MQERNQNRKTSCIGQVNRRASAHMWHGAIAIWLWEVNDRDQCAKGVSILPFCVPLKGFRRVGLIHHCILFRI